MYSEDHDGAAHLVAYLLLILFILALCYEAGDVIMSVLNDGFMPSYPSREVCKDKGTMESLRLNGANETRSKCYRKK